MKKNPTHKRNHKGRGFAATAALIKDQVRAAGETRGFAVSRLLTHWAEIAGEDTARVAVPVRVSYSQGGFGATLTLLTTGSYAPILQADISRIQERVNACYGYSAISRIKITQTAPTGFAEGRVDFHHGKPEKKPQHVIAPETVAQARDLARPVADDGLRGALQALGENVLSRNKQ